MALFQKHNKSQRTLQAFIDRILNYLSKHYILDMNRNDPVQYFQPTSPNLSHPHPISRNLIQPHKTSSNLTKPHPTSPNLIHPQHTSQNLTKHVAIMEHFPVHRWRCSNNIINLKGNHWHFIDSILHYLSHYACLRAYPNLPRLNPNLPQLTPTHPNPIQPNSTQLTLTYPTLRKLTLANPVVLSINSLEHQ